MHIPNYIAPDGWAPDSPNPFADDGRYDGWSCIEIRENRGNFQHGRMDSGLFSMIIDPSLDKFAIRIADFLRYEAQNGRRTIVLAPSDVDVDSLVRESLETYPSGSFLTSDESRWLVHSTTIDAWEEISCCKELKSLASLNQLDKKVVGLGLTHLREPDDYAEYVMLGYFDGIGCENVVASRGKGEIFTEENEAYTPGARLYFDGHGIIRDGLAVWDGIHVLKVHNSLPLDPYLMMSVTAKDVDPDSCVSEWTPRKFLDAANKHFLEQMGISPRM